MWLKGMFWSMGVMLLLSGVDKFGGGDVVQVLLVLWVGRVATVMRLVMTVGMRTGDALLLAGRGLR